MIIIEKKGADGSMPGRKRKLTLVSVGKIGKEEKAARAKAEAALKLPRDDLRPPEYLSERAKEEFMRIVNETERIGILDNLDLPFIAIYANAWDRYQLCLAKILEEGEAPVTKTKYGDKQQLSPYLRASDIYKKDILDCSTKLGLACTDRLKLIVPKKEEKPVSKFDKYLKGNG